MTKIPLSGYSTILSIHSCANRRFSCFLFEVILNKTATDVCLPFFLGKYVGMDWPDHMTIICLTLQDIAKLFSKVLVLTFSFSPDV